jgi:hypothetical protein
MDIPFFGLKLDVVALVATIIAVHAWMKANRADRPLMYVVFYLLEKTPGWYMVSLSIANRAEYGIQLAKLRRIWPLNAKLSPTKFEATLPESNDSGAFTLEWGPDVKAANYEVPVRVALAPRDKTDNRNALAPTRDEGEGNICLYLPPGERPKRFLLLATFQTREATPRRLRQIIWRRIESDGTIT